MEGRGKRMGKGRGEGRGKDLAPRKKFLAPPLRSGTAASGLLLRSGAGSRYRLHGGATCLFSHDFTLLYTCNN